MASLWDTFVVIAQIAFRNLFASRAKTFVVGGIVLFGALLVVVGTSLLDSVDASMKRSIVDSVAGDIQVYSSDSDEDLDVMGGFNVEGSDLEPIDDFAKVREALLEVPHVRNVVPMGISGAFVTSGNTIDLVLEDLRAEARAQAEGKGDQATYEALKGHVEHIVEVLAGDLTHAQELVDADAVNPEVEQNIARASSAGFWREFDADPLDALEFLENEVAGLATDADLIPLRYLGTDPAAYAGSFDRFYVVDGEPIPEGKPGFLFAKYVYENVIKLKTARNIDKIKLERDNRDATIAADEQLQRLVRENRTGVKELMLQLDSLKLGRFREKLQAYLHSDEADVEKLLASFFDLNDANFDQRHAFFYAELAPSLNLYKVPVGSTLTIKAFTRTGYVQSVNVKVYGTFAFRGLEHSPQVGQLNVMDLVSFRNLYGFLTEDRAAEIEALRGEIEVQDVTREDAEAALFGAVTSDNDIHDDTDEANARDENAMFGEAQAESPAEAEASTDRLDLDAALEGIAERRRQAEVARSFDPRDLQRGVVLNMAVQLDDPAQLEATRVAIEAMSEAKGLSLKAVSWQDASGLTGQFVMLMRLILIIAVLIIFVVALVIISNALVMATLERVQEIGTLRALGAQRRFVLGMLLIESILVGLVFGLLGAALGSGIVLWVGAVGLPAQNDIMTFFFSGNRLYPDLGGGNLVLALFIVVVVSVLSSIYPAWIALRVSPRQAMQSEE